MSVVLVAIALGVMFSCVVLRSDAKDQAIHDQWEQRFDEWLRGGMKGPRP